MGDHSTAGYLTTIASSTVRTMFSNTATGLTYDSGTGITSLTPGYTIPLTASTTEWDSKLSNITGLVTAGSNVTITGSGTTGSPYTISSAGTDGVASSSVAFSVFTIGSPGPNYFVVSNTETLIDWQDETFDTNNNFDLTTDRFTPTVAGKYTVTASVYCTDSTSYCQSQIRKNGSKIAVSSQPTTSFTTSQVTTIVDMNGTTDYLEAYVINGGGNYIYAAYNYTYFTGALIAPANGLAGGWSNNGTYSYLADYTDLVVIGTTTAAAKLDIWGSAGSTDILGISSSTGTRLLTLNSAGNLGLSTSSYLTWGSTLGESGYGFRDSAGTIQFKNSGGSWSDLGSGGAFTVLGSDAYFTNGRISIGTTSTSSLLTVQASSTENIFSLLTSGGTNIFTVAGETTSTSTLATNLAITGNFSLSGSLYDSTSSAGTSGMVLQSTGSGTEWVATSSLGITSSGGTDGVASSSVAFSVHKNGTNQTMTASTFTLLTWSTEVFDTNNNFDLTTERFTPTVAGKYMVTLLTFCSDSTASCQASIYKNGALYSKDVNRTSADTGSMITTIVDMNGTTDYLEAYVYNGGGTTISGISSATNFTGALIAPANGLAGGWSNDTTQSYLADYTDLVAIGTTTAAAKLDVWGSAGSTDILGISSSTGSRLLTLTSAGNVGIGTTTPSSKLTVQGDVWFGGNLTATGTLAVLGTGTSTFSGDIEITGSILPSADITYDLGSAARQWRDVYIGPGSLYVNGKKVLEDISDTITITTDLDQNLAMKTTGIGTILLSATSTGSLTLESSSGNININSASGNLNIGTTGSGQFNLGTIDSGVWNGTDIDISDFTNLGVSATGLSLSGDNIALTSGYTIPLTASTTEWDSKLSNVTGLITAGTNVTVTGSGTSGDPYSISSTGSDGVASSSVAFSVHKGGTGQTVATSTWTKLTWSTELFDTNNNFDLTTERFTPTVAGKYIVTASAQCSDGAGTMGACASGIYKNGVLNAYNYFIGANGEGSTVTTVVDMNGTTDYLEAYVYISGGTLAVGASTVTNFSGALIAPANGLAGGWSNDGTQSYLADYTDLVAIGTSTAAAKLDIWGSAGSTDILGISSSTGSRLLTLTSGGNLGLGTTTPSSKLSVYGDVLLEGSSRYLNFGTTAGTSGYGIRDNAGTIEFKNSGGSWTGIGTGTGSTGSSSVSFIARRTTSAQSITQAVETTVDFNSEDFDTNSNFDLTTDRFTPTVAGKYLITANVTANNNIAAGAVAYVTVRKNGVRIATAQLGASNQSATGHTSIVVDMNGTTDYVDVGWYDNEAAPSIYHGTSYTYFSGALIAPANGLAGGWSNDETQSYLADYTDLVAIGTTTAAAKLDVWGSAGSTDILGISSSTGSRLLTLTSAGNLGIGTTTPVSKFVISDASTWTNNFSTLTVSDSGTIGAGLTLASTDTGGKKWSLYSGGSGSSIGAGGFAIYDGTTAANRLVISSSGNVGIGTTTPVAQLTMSGNNSWSGVVGNAVIADSGTVGAGLTLLATGTNGKKWSLVSTASGATPGGGTLGFHDSTANAYRMLINTNGYVSIATTSSAVAGGTAAFLNIDRSSAAVYAISTYINSTTGAGQIAFANPNGVVGSIITSGSATTYNTTSDRRTKENITETVLGLDALMQLPIRDFSFIKDTTHATTSGFIAQELYEIFPWAVSTNGDNGIDPLTGTSTPWSVDYGRITPLLAKSIQDLNLKLEDLASSTAATSTLNTEGDEELTFVGRFFARLVEWFADTTNGIGTMVASVFTATEMICVDDECLTAEDIRQLKGMNNSEPTVVGSGEVDDVNNGDGTDVGGGSEVTPPAQAVLGCTDEVATNYNQDATEDDGSCEYVEGGQVPVTPVLGCTDIEALNYDSSATEENNTCEYEAVPTEEPTEPVEPVAEIEQGGGEASEAPVAEPETI